MEWREVRSDPPEVDPEIGFTSVLVYCKLWGVYPAVIKLISDTKFKEWRDWNGDSVIPPSHWMPLPPPPKAEENE
jgi:hypothetical protein